MDVNVETPHGFLTNKSHKDRGHYRRNLLAQKDQAKRMLFSQGEDSQSDIINLEPASILDAIQQLQPRSNKNQYVRARGAPTMNTEPQNSMKVESSYNKKRRHQTLNATSLILHNSKPTSPFLNVTVKPIVTNQKPERTSFRPQTRSHHNQLAQLMVTSNNNSFNNNNGIMSNGEGTNYGMSGHDLLNEYT